MPNRPVFTRAKNRFPSWDFNNFTVIIVTLPFGSIVPQLSLMLVAVFPHFFVVVVVVVVLFVAVPAVRSFVQLFSRSPPLLDYRHFCNIQKRKIDNEFSCGRRESKHKKQQ